MSRVGGFASVIVVLGAVAGCGSGDQQAAQPSLSSPPPSAAVLPLTETCPLLQDALDANLAEKSDDWQGLAVTVDAIANQADPADAADFREVARTSLIVENSSEPPIVSEGDWLDAMEVITDKCKEAGAPLD